MIIAVLLAAWGGYWGYLFLSDMRSNAINTFESLNGTIGVGFIRVGVRLRDWDPAVGGHIALENIATELATLELVSGLLESTGKTASFWGQPRLTYDEGLSNSLRSLGYALSGLTDRIRVRSATEIDRHFVRASGEQLIAIEDKLRRIPSEHSEHQQLTWPDWEVSVLDAAESLGAICKAYSYEGATAEGTRVAAVSAERAEEIARAHLGPTEDELTTRTTEIVNWWAGVHQWYIWLIDAHDRPRYNVTVDARDGSILGWWDMLPDLPRAKVPLEQAEASARAYLADNLPGEHLLAGYIDEYEQRDSRHGGHRWAFNFFPQIDGVTYFSDPVTVAVAGPDGQVVGCTKPNRTEPIDQMKPDPTPLAAAARESLRTWIEGELEVTAEGWAVRRLSQGDPVLAWAVTAAAPEEPRPELIHAADGSSRPAENRTHLVAFAEAATATHLRPVNLWLNGDSKLHWYGGVRR